MYIVTGGAGFLGSAVVWGLNARGIRDVIVVDNLGSGAKWKNLVGCQYEDYLSREDFLRMVQSGTTPSWAVTGVVHLGACSDTTQDDAAFLMENNFHYSCAVCQWALAHGARYIQASSAATYGDGCTGFDDDLATLHRLRPLNMYGYSKHLFDLWAYNHALFGSIVSLKFFNVYGPNEYHKGSMRSLVCKAYDEINATGKLRLFRSNDPHYPDGGQMRDFVYVKDVVAVIAWLLGQRSVCGVFNVGSGVARTWNDLARAIFAAMNIPCCIEYIPMPESLQGKYQNYTCAPMNNLLATGAPACNTSIEDGVADYVRHYLSTGQYLDADFIK